MSLIPATWKAEVGGSSFLGFLETSYISNKKKKKKKKGGGGLGVVIQEIECLPSICEALGTIPSTEKKSKTDFRK
jgi:hypothetical protein